MRAVVADPALIALPDEQNLAHAASTGRALVSANIKDFVVEAPGDRGVDRIHLQRDVGRQHHRPVPLGREHHHIITTVGYFALATASLVACIAR